MRTEFEEAVNYFQDKPIFLEIFNGLIDKYATYEKFTGTLKKSDLNDTQPLLSFLGVNQATWEKTKRFKLEDFIGAYHTSRFSRVDLNQLIETVAGKKLITKREIIEQEESRQKEYFGEVKKIAPNIFSLLDTTTLKSFFREDIAMMNFKQVEHLWMNPLNKLTRLPVVSYQVTNDPHGLDNNQLAGKVLNACLKAEYPDVDADVELYLKIKIVRDDILNFVTVQNISADDQLFQAASDNHLIWNVPLMELLRLKQVRPNFGKKVFIIENSSVFAILAEKFPDVPMIMSSGQFKYSTWKLLELFDQDIEFYYGSDLDPAGLVMVEKLISKCPERVGLLGMSTEVYQKHLTGGKSLTDQQLKVLDGINLPSLSGLKNVIKQAGKAVYQEAALQDLIEEIKALQNN
jgi:uncharacterized protein (TIGR02679 family)